MEDHDTPALIIAGVGSRGTITQSPAATGAGEDERAETIFSISSSENVASPSNADPTRERSISMMSSVTTVTLL
jgi:hypothetical protein